MSSMFERTKFKKHNAPNTVGTRPGPGLGTRRPKMKEFGAIETSININILIRGQSSATG